jgi:RNA polymerase sigma factor (sigma-70 family)
VTAAVPTDAQLRLAGRLYSRYSADLLAMFRSTRRISRVDAVDLLQQTFSELLATLARQPELEIQHPRAFLFKLATRQLYALSRKEQREPSLDDEAPVAQLASQRDMDDLECCASLRAEQRLLLRAMRRLTDGPDSAADRRPQEVSELQLLVYFRFWVGLSLGEVAEIFEVSSAVVSGRQRRGLRKLQRIVAELQVTEGTSESTSTTVLTRWRELLERSAAVGGAVTPLL